MAVLAHDTIPLRSDDDIILARHTVRAWTRQQGFSLIDQTKLVTAASELARNTVRYGGGGSMRLEVLSEQNRLGLQLTFEDQGPGIQDINLALQDGYTTGDGLGLGLGGAKRLSDKFEIASAPGQGTQVRIVRWK
jgi:serine/threonine-protein kinase RsbT